MGSISNNLLSVLTQPGGPLANLPVQLSASALQSAPPQDLVALSAASLKLQQVDGLFGISPNAQNGDTSQQFTLPPYAGTSASPTPSSATLGLPSGVSESDLNNATPNQQASIAQGMIQQQMLEALFNPPTSSGGTINQFG